MIREFWSARNEVADDSVLLGCDAASMYNRIPTFRSNLWFSSSMIQAAEEDSTVPDFRSNLLSLYSRGNFSDASTVEYEETTLSWNVDVDYPVTQRHISQELNPQTRLCFLNAISRMNFRRYIRESRTCLFHYSDQPHSLNVKEKLSIWSYHTSHMPVCVCVCVCVCLSPSKISTNLQMKCDGTPQVQIQKYRLQYRLYVN